MYIHFSLVAPSIRPHLWERFCNSLLSSKLNWEVIFVGPFPPISQLPSNFRWIEATCKPSQCTHIGFMEAKGEIISLTADDTIYFSPNENNSIDNMYNFIKNYKGSEFLNPLKLAYGFRMFEDDFCAETSLTHYINFVSEPKTTPLLYPYFAIYRDFYSELGGYDSRFITGQAENDLQLRIAYHYGNSKGTLCSTAMVWAQHSSHDNKGKFREYHAQDSATLKKLWRNQEGFHIRTNEELRPYNYDSSIYKVSQGEKGEWI